MTNRVVSSHRRQGLGTFLIPLSCLLVGFSLGSILFAPARWIAYGVGLASDQRVTLPNISGTLWSGRSDVVIASGVESVDKAVLQGGISWNASVSWSSGPVLKIDLQAPCCTSVPIEIAGGITINGPRVQLSANRATFPLGLLVGAGTPWNTIQLSGQLLVENAAVYWSGIGQSIQGRASIRLDNLSSALSTLRPLGTYTIEVTSPNSVPNIALGTLGGPLQLSGTGTWLDGRFIFRGLAEAQPGFTDALSNLLNILGQRDGAARAILSFG